VAATIMLYWKCMWKSYHRSWRDSSRKGGELRKRNNSWHLDQPKLRNRHHCCLRRGK